MEVGNRELVGDALTSMLVEVASLRSGTVNMSIKLSVKGHKL